MIKRLDNFFTINYIFKNLIPFIYILSNFVIPSFNSPSISVNSTKLEKGLQSILRSLGQYLFTKIHLSKLSNCKRDFLKLVNIPSKEKSFQFQFVDQYYLRFDGQGIQL